jgi:two-component system sensor histidine kinase KdpD
LLLASAALPAITVAGVQLREHISFAADVPVYLFVVVLTSLVGGVVPAVLSAIAASLLLNYYFVAPLHTLTIEATSNIIALIVFLLIALLVSAVVDLAARRRWQAAQVEPLAEAAQQRTALLNAVSHDLRTPLAAAKAAISSLRGPEVTWDEADRHELLATAEHALDRLTDLVTNLLDLSRLQAGALPVLRAPVGLDDVVAHALDSVAADQRVEVDVAPSLPEVVADAGLLERVVANVVENALRYAPADRPVQVVGRALGELVELCVIDRGPGFPGGGTDALFRPFQRGDDVPSNGAGVGLGLAIARGLSEAMGGTVRAEQTPGGGATVVVVLRAVTPA